MTKQSRATFVLVHGAGHGGWCWTRLAPLLRAAGHDVYTPTLTGLGERVHLLTPDVGLNTHITDIANVLFYEDLRDVILVGHSYGGVVIKGAADRALDRVRHLVYLDATMALNGESVADTAPLLRTAADDEGETVNGVRLVLWPGRPLSRGIYGITDPGDLAWMEARLKPQPWKCFDEPLALKNEAAVDRIPRTLINCPATLRMRGPEQSKRYLTGDRVWEIDTAHDLMISEPWATADMLLKVAAL